MRSSFPFQRASQQAVGKGFKTRTSLPSTRASGTSTDLITEHATRTKRHLADISIDPSASALSVPLSLSWVKPPRKSTLHLFLCHSAVLFVSAFDVKADGISMDAGQGWTRCAQRSASSRHLVASGILPMSSKRSCRKSKKGCIVSLVWATLCCQAGKSSRDGTFEKCSQVLLTLKLAHVE